MLQDYLKSPDFGTKFQSAYKSNNITETAFLRVLNDLLRLGPQSYPTMLVLVHLLIPLTNTYSLKALSLLVYKVLL